MVVVCQYLLFTGTDDRIECCVISFIRAIINNGEHDDSSIQKKEELQCSQ